MTAVCSHKHKMSSLCAFDLQIDFFLYLCNKQQIFYVFFVFVFFLKGIVLFEYLKTVIGGHVTQQTNCVFFRHLNLICVSLHILRHERPFCIGRVLSSCRVGISMWYHVGGKRCIRAAYLIIQKPRSRLLETK